MKAAWRPWRESNPHLGLRSALLCPLSYGGVRHGLYRTVAGAPLDRKMPDAGCAIRALTRMRPWRAGS